MKTQFNYVTKLDVIFDHLQKIGVPQMVRECRDKWFNQTLASAK